MAAPSYTEDLTDIDLAQSLTNWLQINFSGGGGGALGTGADFAMQGTLCVDRQVSSHERGAMYDNTSGITLGANDHIFQWGFVATPGITDLLSIRGAYCIAGTATNALVQFHVDGLDTYGAQGRVGKCYAYRYVTTANTTAVPYRTLTGSPGANPQYFGFGIKTTAAAKSANVGVDAIRYGTGGYLTAGELISAGDGSDDPCSFRGFSTTNDYNDATNGYNRWGILSAIGGSNYELQGRFAIGQNNSQTATLARFRDSNVNISLIDTVHSLADFTQFIIDHASTRCEWNNINITALGGNNPGQIQVTSADPTFLIDGGTYTDIGVTVLRSNTTATGVTWFRCDEVTANGASMNDCNITHGSKIIDAQDETNYGSPSAFSGGTGYVANDIIYMSDDSRITVDAVTTGAVTQFTVDSTDAKRVEEGVLNQVSTSGSGTGFTITPSGQNYTESSALIWDVNSDPDGELDGMIFDNLTPSMTHAIEFGTNIPTTITLRNCAFGTNYSATEGGTTGNETFWFRDTSPTSITINLVGCSGNFGYKTDGADITVVADPVTVTVNVLDNNSSPLFGARVILKASNGTGPLPYQDSVTITRSGSTATVSHTGHGLATNQKVEIKGANEADYNGAKTITFVDANSYTFEMNSPFPSSPATGTITSTGIVIEGITDSSGVITDSRTYSSAQPVVGSVRSASGSPYFKVGPLTGTISTTTGLSLTSQLILDES